MELERKAIYNLLRMNKHDGKTCSSWQVENLRLKSLDALFKDLSKVGIDLDSRHFAAHAEAYDTPEEFSDALANEDLDAKESDKIYLIVFELWRRLIPEKRSVSIICDELDECIHLYDEGALKKEEEIQDSLNQLVNLLDENIDEGLNPQKLFEVIQANLANDLESFLYDYISEKIDEEDYDFAQELIDDFQPFISESIWFDFLKVKVLANKDSEKANLILEKLATEKHSDIEFSLELLEFLAKFGDEILFLKLAKKTCSLIENEDEFQDLLLTTEKYFSCLDKEAQEANVSNLLKQRSKKPLDSTIDKNDPDLKIFLSFLQV
jgi:hypothetical protein